MIPFQLPQLSMSLAQYMEIVQARKEISSSIGFLISLGNKCFKSGTKEVDETIAPLLHNCSSSVNPRVIPSYSKLMWFTIQVSSYILFNGQSNSYFSDIRKGKSGSCV
jgi:hypothetical protein